METHPLDLAKEVCELIEAEPSSSVHGQERHLLKQTLDLEPPLELLHKPLECDKVEVAGLVHVRVLRCKQTEKRASVSPLERT